jgi:hypothetical protein
MRYVEKPQTPKPVIAAQYRAGEPLDDLLAVARQCHPDATALDVPEWRVLLVRRLVVPDDRPAYVDYLVVEDGDMLVYSDRYDALFVEDAEEFRREYDSAGAE